MKPANFDYHDPTSVDEALGLMAQFGDQARRGTEYLEQDSDIHASAEYRRAACAALARRALMQAAQCAAERMKGPSE
jgi:CO/xanthine dehydrogenase FAD-binding subunit